MFQTHAAHLSKSSIVSACNRLVMIVFLLSGSLFITSAIFLLAAPALLAQTGRFIPMPPVFASGGIPRQVDPGGYK